MNTTRLAAALALSLTLMPLAALAHVFPQKQEPGAGTTVEAPAKVTIAFDGPLEPAFSSLTVTDAAGKQVSTAKSTIDAQQPSVASVALPALAAGKYTVHWVAVASDGHRTHGDYSFNVK
ncbi:copper resistance CopC family protein [Paraburkholderia caribensis]|uniref:copper resistance CopC family protein n=1 Tax=Paraburkholderia caribensis TaxID=75105 RepID=UPI0007200C8F|nr:copper resistance protein CopC [Paraburkholderia caribensis]ALP64744.1 copper resistance protein [Paraburkholderia caribensis]AUT54108.1 copper resistance protein [Paraburkholderia caribensis]